MISRADALAVRELLGPRATHAKVIGLPGADLCPHILAGSGIPVSKLSADANVAEWVANPYRHHDYVRLPALRMPSSADMYCVCGNSQKHRVHVLCVEPE